jgi:hypothetical protein
VKSLEQRIEHTLHGDAAAITVLLLVARFDVVSFVVGAAPQTAAHVNFVFGQTAHATVRPLLNEPSC